MVLPIVRAIPELVVQLLETWAAWSLTKQTNVMQYIALHCGALEAISRFFFFKLEKKIISHPYTLCEHTHKVSVLKHSN